MMMMMMKKKKKMMKMKMKMMLMMMMMMMMMMMKCISYLSLISQFYHCSSNYCIANIPTLCPCIVSTSQRGF